MTTPDTNNQQARLGDMVRRIDAGEFDGGDKYHRFVVKEIYPQLIAGTLAAGDLIQLSRAWALHSMPAEHGNSAA